VMNGARTETAGFSRQHVAVAVAAAAFSLALHLVLFVYLRGVELSVPVTAGRALRELPARSMRLLEVWRGAAAKEPRESARAWDAGLAEEALRGVDEPRLAPDEAALRPPQLGDGLLAGEEAALARPEARPAPPTGLTRQEMLVIEHAVVADNVGIPRRVRVPGVERVEEADVSFIMPPAAGAGAALAAVAPPSAATGAASAGPVAGGATGGVGVVAIGEERAESGAGLYPEPREEITSLQPVEDLLTVDITVFESLRDIRYGYFRMVIRRIGPEALPVMPKDVALVQDGSASMTEQRLYFCREGMIRALDQIGPDDRFNVVGFKDDVQWCFRDWAANNPERRAEARAFIQALQSSGETDIFASTKALLSLKRDATRPVVVVLVTDGRPTTGLTDSSDIIAQFTRANAGEMALFTMGTVQTANAYLLDLLAYCNGGGSLVVTRGRWDIPDALERVASETSRPVLHDIGFRFAEGGGCEVFPAATGNLYLDRTLVLLGRYPRGTESVLFQAVGRGRDAVCDMIFDVGLRGAARSRDEDLRAEWARQKLYHLIGAHARGGQPELLDEIRATARAYGIDVPYRREVLP